MKLAGMDKIGSGAVVVWLSLIALMIVGWVLNIIDLFNAIGVEPPVMGVVELVLRLIGVFVPVIGALMGWFV